MDPRVNGSGRVPVDVDGGPSVCRWKLRHNRAERGRTSANCGGQIWIALSIGSCSSSQDPRALGPNRVRCVFSCEGRLRNPIATGFADSLEADAPKSTTSVVGGAPSSSVEPIRAPSEVCSPPLAAKADYGRKSEQPSPSVGRRLTVNRKVPASDKGVDG